MPVFNIDQQEIEMTKRIFRTRDILETVLAIETLEYHDMNHLSCDIKKRNETKRALLSEALSSMGGSTAKDNL